MNRPIANLGGAVILVVAASNCIVPPDAANCPCSNGSSSSSASPSSSNASSSTSESAAANAPPGVKPTAAQLSDGTSPNILNVNPPGSWFVMNDRTAKGTMSPTSNGDFASAIVGGGVHSEGKGYTDWGGGIGFNFVGADSLTPLDASAYSGISFKLSGSAPVHVALATVATMPDFGVCTKCYDHFSVDISDLSSTPRVYSYKWSQLHAGGWGAPHASLDPKTLIGLNFTSKGAAPWNFSVHEVTLVQ
jgi:hypothetical protein